MVCLQVTSSLLLVLALTCQVAGAGNAAGTPAARSLAGASWLQPCHSDAGIPRLAPLFLLPLLLLILRLRRIVEGRQRRDADVVLWILHLHFWAGRRLYCHVFAILGICLGH